MRQIILLIAASFWIATLPGCNAAGLGDATGKAKDDASNDDVKQGDETNDNVNDEMADEPQIVAGAFLTCAPIEVESTDDSSTIGCAVYDASGFVDISGYSPEWRAVDAAGNDVTTPVPATDPNFHVQMTLTPAQVETTTVTVTLIDGDLEQAVGKDLKDPDAPVYLKTIVIGSPDGGEDGTDWMYLDNSGPVAFDFDTGAITCPGATATSIRYHVVLSNGVDMSDENSRFDCNLGTEGLVLAGDWAKAGTAIQAESSAKRIGRVMDGALQKDATNSDLSVSWSGNRLTINVDDPDAGGVAGIVEVNFSKE
jgi:hypothetical protein